MSIGQTPKEHLAQKGYTADPGTFASSGLASAPLPPIRVELLKQGINLTSGDRDVEYGSPRVNLTCAGELKRVFHKYSSMSNRRLSSAEQEAIDMVITKISRVACGEQVKADTYIDGATYFAIAGEAAIEADQNGSLEYAPATQSRPEPGLI